MYQKVFQQILNFLNIALRYNCHHKIQRKGSPATYLTITKNITLASAKYCTFILRYQKLTLERCQCICLVISKKRKLFFMFFCNTLVTVNQIKDQYKNIFSSDMWSSKKRQWILRAYCCCLLFFENEFGKEK